MKAILAALFASLALTMLSLGQSQYTAEVNLRKSIKNGIITWSGVMRNYDGRNVAVRFTKNH